LLILDLSTTDALQLFALSAAVLAGVCIGGFEIGRFANTTRPGDHRIGVAAQPVGGIGAKVGLEL
jgi:hypothetical protein